MKLETAMILAAGLGTRMRPLTLTRPKPLIELGGKPLIDWCLEWLRDGGITRAVVNSSYLADQLDAHLQKSTILPELHLSREEPPALETGGGVLKALPMLGDMPFLTMNSDAVFTATPEHPLQQMVKAWRDDKDFLMLLVPISRIIGGEMRGDFMRLEDGRIRRPREGEVAEYLFTGVEMMHPRVFTQCPEGPFSLSDLWNRSRDEDGVYHRIRSVVYDADWLNVGNP
jgi:MurNAc alpha-1-phosphate uridylyltransferase